MLNESDEERDSQLKLIATKSLAANPDLVYLVDFLNRSLKEKKVIFGVKKNKETNEMIINIYEI